MPTYEAFESFWDDYDRMDPVQQRRFLAARLRFVANLRNGQFSPSLRIKRLQGHHGIWELTWAPDGRATFEYGDEVISGEPHVIWRRVGTHEIFDRP